MRKKNKKIKKRDAQEMNKTKADRKKILDNNINDKQ